MSGLEGLDRNFGDVLVLQLASTVETGYKGLSETKYTLYAGLLINRTKFTIRGICWDFVVRGTFSAVL